MYGRFNNGLHNIFNNFVNLFHMFIVLGLLSLVASSSSDGLPPPLDISRLTAGDARCQADLTTLAQGLDRGHVWAQQMVDASVKGPVGVLSQTAIQFGDFDECLSINVSAPVSAQYCLVDLSPAQGNSLWSKFKWAICVPASCSEKTLTTSLQSYFDQLSGGILVEVVPKACTTRDSAYSPMTAGNYFYCAVMVGVLLVVLSCTLHDIHTEPTVDGSSPPRSITQCLSARFGYLGLQRRDKSVAGVDTNALYGLHAISIFFVVLGHRFMSHIFLMTLTNYNGVLEMYSYSWFSIWAGHMDVFVDLFFFMSSFILSLFYYAELSKRYVNPILVYLNRYCRLVPAYSVVIFFYVHLLRHLATGPMWKLFIEEEENNCYQNWWTNLLFVNTYLTPYNMCVPQSWYVSCDFQLFVVSTLLVLLFHRMPRLGTVVAVVLFIVSTAILFSATYINDLPGMLIFLKEFLTDYHHDPLFTTVYSQAHYRVTSYLGGLLTGILVFKLRGNTLSTAMTRTLQVSGITIVLLVYWSGSWFYDKNFSPSRLVSAVYAATFHTIFGIGFSLIIISFTLGKPTLLSKFFSWKQFVPISKISFIIYLVHMIPQLTWVASSRTPVYLNPLELLSWSIADFVLSVIGAFVLYLTVETPFRYLFNYCIKEYFHSPSPKKAASDKTKPL